jgi:cell division septal protein FtsQ
VRDGLIAGLIGAGAVVLGPYLGLKWLAIMETWPKVDALVVSSQLRR